MSRKLSGLLVVFWFLVTIAVVFLAGVLAFVLQQPYIPVSRDWLESISLYDFLSTFGFGYIILTSLAAIDFGWSLAAEMTYFKNDRREGLAFVALGVFILLSLLIGKLFLGR